MGDIVSGGILTLSINNWSKYQDRPDRKNYTWFKFESDFFRDSKMYFLSKDQKLLFIFLLCQRNKSLNDDFDIISDEACLFMGVVQNELLSHLDVLVKQNLISIKSHAGISPAEAVIEPSLDKIRLDKIRGDKTLDQNKFDLECLYLLYPRKIGKKKGFEKLKVLVKNQETFDQVKKSILNYAAYCSKNITESRYIKHFSTFVTSWEDHLDPVKEFKNTKKIDISAILRGEV